VPRPKRKAKPGIGLPTWAIAAGVPAFALVYLLTASIEAGLVGGVIGAGAMVIWLVRRRRERRRRAARTDVR
jgi:Flp pilus assembly protein TadB